MYVWAICRVTSLTCAEGGADVGVDVGAAEDEDGAGEEDVPAEDEELLGLDGEVGKVALGDSGVGRAASCDEHPVRATAAAQAVAATKTVANFTQQIVSRRGQTACSRRANASTCTPSSIVPGSPEGGHCVSEPAQ